MFAFSMLNSKFQKNINFWYFSKSESLTFAVEESIIEERNTEVTINSSDESFHSCVSDVDVSQKGDLTTSPIDHDSQKDHINELTVILYNNKSPQSLRPTHL